MLIYENPSSPINSNTNKNNSNLFIYTLLYEFYLIIYQLSCWIINLLVFISGHVVKWSL